MNNWILIISIMFGCLICWPLFKYMYKAVFQNAPDFDQGYKEVKGSDATEDFITAHGSSDTTVNSFVFYNFIVLLLPFIPACFIAVPIYFLLEWLYQYAT